jgi:hypothetical protein
VLLDKQTVTILANGYDPVTLMLDGGKANGPCGPVATIQINQRVALNPDPTSQSIVCPSLDMSVPDLGMPDLHNAADLFGSEPAADLFEPIVDGGVTD